LPADQTFQSFGGLNVAADSAGVGDHGLSLRELVAIFAMINDLIEKRLSMAIVVHLC
jgi:hypothetical protein